MQDRALRQLLSGYEMELLIMPKLISFASLEIPDKALLISTIDPDERCVVAGDHHVQYCGKTMSLSQSALVVLLKNGSKRSTAQGTRYWTFRGRTLLAIARDR